MMLLHNKVEKYIMICSNIYMTLRGIKSITKVGTLNDLEKRGASKVKLT